MTKYINPFSIPAAESMVEDRMVALYSILHLHQEAQREGDDLQLPFGKARWNMGTWLSQPPAKGRERFCETAACAAGSAALVPWFHTVAKSVGVETRLGDSRINPDFVSDPDIWGDAWDEMHQLFTAGSEVYQGIARDLDGDGPDLYSLTVRQVKAALKRIVRNHFGEEGVKRCEAMDRRSCDLTALSPVNE